MLDVGGTVEYWEQAPIRPADVTILNLEVPDSAPPGFEVHEGDACQPPRLCRARADLVYSNSVIEHVGGYAERMSSWRR